ncbi:E3 ubiquitin-protein ligase RHA2B-like [Fagus crenata]
MKAVSEFFANLKTMTKIFFTLLLIEIIILIRSLTGLSPKSDKRVITTNQYLKLIEKKNPTTRFNKRMTMAEPIECRVCLSEFEEGDKIRKLQCNHTFHKDCLDSWLQQYCRATCPLCRTKVLPDDIVASYRRMRNQVEYDGNDEELIFFLSALHGNSVIRLF